ncbi:MAG TPA: RNA polymerase sigma factor, partial [Planctomycetota bacterium]|nr:RNA polymerase sigma factor [Planctomycetota bacterium]
MDPDPPPPRLDELVQQADWVRSLARQLVRDEADADDLAQETLLAALRKPPKKERELRPWLVRVARNLGFRKLRDASARRGREERAARPEVLPSAAELAAQADLVRAIAEALLELREPARSALLLRHRDGLTSEEIAARLEIPAATVRSHLSRGLRALRERLDDRHGDRRSWVVPATELAGLRTAGRDAAPWIAWAASSAAIVVVAAAVYATAFPRTRAATDGPALARAGDAATIAEGARDASASSRVPEGFAAPAPPDADARPTLAPVEGEVVDIATGERAPRFAVEIRRADGATELVETDDEGRFRTAKGYAAGELRVALRDRPDAPPLRTVAYEHASASSARFEVPLGP